MAQGLTLFFEDQNSPCLHLSFVVAMKNEICFLANITSSPYDKTTILYPNDHPEIKHESYLYWAFARIIPFVKITNWLRKNPNSRKTPASHALQKRLYLGALNSQFCSIEGRDFVLKNFVHPPTG